MNITAIIVGAIVGSAIGVALNIFVIFPLLDKLFP
jgi:riboflavin transporter FmnP